MLSRARRNCRRAANPQNIGVGARCVRTRKTSSWIVARVDCSAAAILDYTRRIGIQADDTTTGSNGEGIRYIQKRRKKEKRIRESYHIWIQWESKTDCFLSQVAEPRIHRWSLMETRTPYQRGISRNYLNFRVTEERINRWAVLSRSAFLFDPRTSTAR